MKLSPDLLSLIADLNARNDFEHVASVTLDNLIPGKPEDQWFVDRASAWAEDRQHRNGRCRRRVFAGSHRVTWEFEFEGDATQFRQAFVRDVASGERAKSLE